MNTIVSIVKCEDYTPSNVLRAVKEAVDLLGGMDKFVTPGQKVLLKPNLLAPRSPDSAVCTHPAVTEAVAGLAAAAGGLCSIGDSPSVSGETPDRYSRLLQISGMQDVIERTGASPVRFDDSGTEREVPEAKVFRRFLIADAVDDADVLINIPKFKTHELTLITGAVKNLYGCIPGRRKVEYHLQAGDDPEFFAQILVDLLHVVRPSLSIMDGIAGMDGQGPSAGRRRNFGLIMASADPVALDAAACLVAGVDPMTIPTLRLAAEQGVGIADPADVEIVGCSPADARIADFMLPPRGDIISRVPKPLYRMLRNQLIRRPVISHKKCTACGMCMETCPVHAISGEENRLRVDYSTCIRCYCCQEVCPQEAISLRAGLLRGPIEAAMAFRRKVKRFLKREASGS